MINLMLRNTVLPGLDIHITVLAILLILILSNPTYITLDMIKVDKNGLSWMYIARF